MHDPSSPLNRARQALIDGNVSALEAALAAGADPNARMYSLSRPDVPLLLVPWGSRPREMRKAFLRVLLAAGANPDARGPMKRTALHFAAAAGDTGAIDLLIEFGADVTARDENQETPLQVALSADGTGHLLRLLAAGAPPDVFCGPRDGRTALLQALLMERLDAAQTLLAHGAHPDIGESDGFSPLHMILAAQDDQDLLEPSVDLLLAHGADPNLPAPIVKHGILMGRTPTLLAAYNALAALRQGKDWSREKRILITLLAHGGSTDRPDEAGATVRSVLAHILSATEILDLFAQAQIAKR